MSKPFNKLYWTDERQEHFNTVMAKFNSQMDIYVEQMEDKTLDDEHKKDAFERAFELHGQLSKIGMEVARLELALLPQESREKWAGFLDTIEGVFRE
tara:strand:- start:99 stop:389 length:291 start_codon:yes stop_codon:yes gene_type:complete